MDENLNNELSTTQLKQAEEKAIQLMEADCEEFQDQVSMDDITLSNIILLQSGTPFCNKNSTDYVEGAEAGLLFNKSDHTIYDKKKGINIVPIIRRTEYLEATIESGGSNNIVKNHGLDSSLFDNTKVNESYKKILNNGNEIFKQISLYCFLINEDQTFEPVIIRFRRTSLKKMKDLNRMSQMNKSQDGKLLPLFSRVYNLKTKIESNNKQTWFNYDIKQKGLTLLLPKIGQVLYTESKKAVLDYNNNLLKINDEPKADTLKINNDNDYNSGDASDYGYDTSKL